MRIAVIGVGVAGSYLVSMLSGSHDVIGYERQREENYRAICAWAASRYPMERFARNAGLDFHSYILHEGHYFTIMFGDDRLDVKVTGLVTFDKEAFEMDLRKGRRIIYGVNVDGWNIRTIDYDLVIDSTGFYRSVIGRPEQDIFIPTVEYMVRYRELPYDDFYTEVFKGLSGFLWFFPLGNGRAHLGAGDLAGNHTKHVEEFLSRHRPVEKLRKVGRPLRLAPPRMVTPLSTGRIFAVGESAGVVFPTTGEGIIPSLQNSDLLMELIHRGELGNYEHRMFELFKLHERTARVFFDMLLKGRTDLQVAMRLALLASSFSRRSRRFGLKPGVMPLIKAMMSYAGRRVLTSFK